MTRSGQLALDLGHRPALGREDFLVAPCNEDAVAWIDRWPDWPGPALVIHGPAGCGKTHLARVWRRRSGATEAAVVEDADRPVDDVALFHLDNQHAEDVADPESRMGGCRLPSRTVTARLGSSSCPPAS